MKRITISILIFFSMLVSSASAKNSSIEDVVLACFLDPASCVASIDAMEFGDKKVEVTLGLLAVKLYNASRDVNGDGLSAFYVALYHVSELISPYSTQRGERVLALAERVRGRFDGDDSGQGDDGDDSGQGDDGDDSGQGDDGDDSGQGDDGDDSGQGDDGDDSGQGDDGDDSGQGDDDDDSGQGDDDDDDDDDDPDDASDE